MIASHYAEPVERHLLRDAALHGGPDGDSNIVATLPGGTRFLMLDNTSGWAWGYAGDERRVGYVRAEAVGT